MKQQDETKAYYRIPTCTIASIVHHYLGVDHKKKNGKKKPEGEKLLVSGNRIEM
jgi:hypothetical protein